MRAGLGVGVGWCGQVWADMGKGGQFWMDQTDRAGIGDMASGWVWVCAARRQIRVTQASRA